MAEYIVSREQLTSSEYTGIWNINNPLRETTLCQEIISTTTITKTLSSPGLICIGNSCTLFFNEPLSGEEETIFYNLINAHKNNL